MLAWSRRLVALVLLSLPASAQTQVQLQLSGEVKNENGGSIDIEIAVRASEGSEPQQVALHLALLGHTSALDVAMLLEARLTDAHIRHVAPAPSSERLQATLFVEGVSRVLLRASGGLGAAVGLPQSAPASVQLLPPLLQRGRGALKIHGLTQDLRLKERGVLDFKIDLDEETSPTSAGELLATACAQAHWLSERPTHETWKPATSFEGRDLIGTSFTLDASSADWGLELRMP